MELAARDGAAVVVVDEGKELFDHRLDVGSRRLD